MTLLLVCVGAAIAGLAAAAAPASAHGIGEGAAGRTTLEFIPLGIEHMALGWDHLLFIAGVVILAGNPGRAAKLVSLFALGHSLTLLVATIAGWKLNATFVDVVIALSVVYVGVLGVRAAAAPAEETTPMIGDEGPKRGANWRLIAATIFGFGLIHGLGLSTRLQDLGLPEDGLVGRVIAFNVGVELGQLSALAVIAAVGYFVLPNVNWPVVRRYAYMGLVVIGLVAATILSLAGATRDESPATTAGTDANPGCEQTDTDPPGTLAGGHPGKRFYRPGEPVPTVDLEHVIGDGYVVVRYRPEIARRDLTALEDWVGRNSQAIAAAAADQEEAVKATTAYRELACGRFDIAALTEFGDTWFTDVREGRVQ